MEIFLARTVLRTRSSIYKEFFAKVVNSFELFIFFANNFIHKRLTVRYDSNYISATSFVYEIMLAIDDFSSKRFEWINRENQKFRHNYRLTWYCLMLFIKQYFSYNFFLYYQSFAVFCIKKKMDLKGVNCCTFWGSFTAF